MGTVGIFPQLFCEIHRAVGMSEISGRGEESSNVVGIICVLVGIGLTDLGGRSPSVPTALINHTGFSPIDLKCSTGPAVQ